MSASSFEEYESELRKWTDQLKLVDALLDRPSATLIRELAHAAEAPDPTEENPWRVAGNDYETGPRQARIASCPRHLLFHGPTPVGPAPPLHVAR